MNHRAHANPLTQLTPSFTQEREKVFAQASGFDSFSFPQFLVSVKEGEISCERVWKGFMAANIVIDGGFIMTYVGPLFFNHMYTRLPEQDSTTTNA